MKKVKSKDRLIIETGNVIEKLLKQFLKRGVSVYSSFEKENSFNVYVEGKKKGFFGWRSEGYLEICDVVFRKKAIKIICLYDYKGSLELSEKIAEIFEKNYKSYKITLVDDRKNPVRTFGD